MHLDLLAVEGKDFVPRADRYSSTETYNQKLKEIHVKISGYFKRDFLIGNGIDEFIDLIILWKTQAEKAKKAHLLAPGYGRYEQSVKRHGINAFYSKRYELTDNKKIMWRTIESIIQEVLNSSPDIMIFSNPGNPTPDFYSIQEIELLLSKVPRKCTIVIDEAFIDYATNNEYKTALPLINKFPNLVVLRTFSKAYGLFGIRIGMLFSNEAILEKIKKFKRLYTVSQSSIESFLEIFDEKIFRNYRKKIFHLNKKRQSEFLSKAASIPFLRNSQILANSTNFCLLVSKDPLTGNISAKEITSKFEIPDRRVYRIRIPNTEELEEITTVINL